MYEKKLTVLFNNADEFKKRRLPVVYGFIKSYSRALGTKKLIIYKFSILVNKCIFFFILLHVHVYRRYRGEGVSFRVSECIFNFSLKVNAT